jgi:hypothetical protein
VTSGYRADLNRTWTRDAAVVSPPSERTNVAAWVLVIVVAGLILLAPALWNGFPLLQYDTGGYLARWYEGYLVPSRPGAYGLMLAAGASLQFWPVLLVQVALTIWVLALLLRSLGLGAKPLLLLGTVSLLSVATTLPWLTAILLTDIFAGLGVLALYLVVFCGDKLGRWERLGLVALTAFAAATHSATLLLIGALAATAVMAHWFAGELVPRRGARYALIVALAGIAMTLAANFAVVGRLAWTPGGYGIVFGRMLQDGIVDRYLEDHCHEMSLKLCPFRDQLPRDPNAFLWGKSVFDQLGRFDGLGDEMRTIVLGSLREYPALQAVTAMRAAGRQLILVSTGDGVVTTLWHTYGIMERYTPSVVAAMRAARQQHGELHFHMINRVQVPIALVSMAILPALIALWRNCRAFARFGLLAATTMTALLINAFLCGALSNPHDRYGARLIWLAPLTIGLGLLFWLRRPDPKLLSAARFISDTSNYPINSSDAASQLQKMATAGNTPVLVK